MEDNRAEQREALEALASYNVRLVKSMKGVVKELSGEREADTDEYLNKIIQGINWEIQVLNGTLSLINEDGERVNKEQVNAKIIVLGDAVVAKDDAKIAAAMEALVPVFEEIGAVAKDIAA